MVAIPSRERYNAKSGKYQAAIPGAEGRLFVAGACESSCFYDSKSPGEWHGKCFLMEGR
jgi:hypothetical protein